MSRLASSVLPIRSVAQSMRRDMYALFQRHYEDVDLVKFLADFEEKDAVIVLRDSAGSRRRNTERVMTRHEAWWRSRPHRGVCARTSRRSASIACGASTSDFSWRRIRDI